MKDKSARNLLHLLLLFYSLYECAANRVLPGTKKKINLTLDYKQMV